MYANLEELQAFFSKQLKQYHLNQSDTVLYEPINYLLSLPSKQIRPVLTLVSTQLCGEDYKKALYPAIGVELFHNFSLMHDDIMDNADLRRGFPSVHKKWNVNQAILSGDVMLLEAYRHIIFYVDKKLSEKVFELFTQTSIDVCIGQQMDMDFETRSDVRMEEYMQMIRCKTGVLLGFALQMGAIIANASEEICSSLFQLGEKLGIAFQLRDDYLDVYGTAQFGKTKGGDIMMGKKTFLSIKAFELADSEEKNLIYQIFERRNASEQEVQEVEAIFSKYSIDKQLEQLIEQYSQEASDICSSLPFEEGKKAPLFKIIEKLKYRGK